MVRYRKIKKYGDTWVIKLNPSDVIDLSWKDGDLVNIEDVVKKGGKKQNE